MATGQQGAEAGRARPRPRSCDGQAQTEVESHMRHVTTCVVWCLQVHREVDGKGRSVMRRVMGEGRERLHGHGTLCGTGAASFVTFL